MCLQFTSAGTKYMFHFTGNLKEATTLRDRVHTVAAQTLAAVCVRVYVCMCVCVCVCVCLCVCVYVCLYIYIY